MAPALDQVFVTLHHWVVALCPAFLQPWVSLVLPIAAIIGVFAGLFAVVTVLERKGLGRIQNRYGPNRVGPFGFLQFAADGIKTLTKEDVVPRSADKVVHFLAPIALVTPVLLSFSVLPFGRNMVPVDFDAGLMFFFAVGAATELSVFMAGWSSRNKYALLGGMRAIAQMISYELPLILSSVTVVMAAGSLSLPAIVAAQQDPGSVVQPWFVFTPWGFAGFLLFLVSSLAEANRSPFDLPEGESEIIAGYYIEYSGFKFALFFLGEYLGMFAVAGLGITLFLGGWTAPVNFLEWVPSWAWFMGKLMGLIVLFIWIRGTLPRLRMDQLMNLAWKFMLPLALINIASAGLWRFLPSGPIRWAVCGALVVIPYVLLGRALGGAHAGMRGRAPRSYRFAD